MNKSKMLLEKLRLSSGFSQTDIAKRLDVSRPTYVLMEQGKKELTLKQAELLSGIYDISSEAIRTGKITKQKFSEKDIVVTTLPTKFGVFDFGVWNQPKGEEVVFLKTKNLDPLKPVLVRIQSECMTGEVFHSYRCDCGEQKDKAMEIIADHGNGVLIYLRQEGRGIGLHEKIKTYLLQDEGYDTHEANILLGHKPDYREYNWAKKILDHLCIKEIKLLTNNPSKVSEISRLGVRVVERVPLVVESNSYNRKYFETKRQKFKHFFGKEESNYFYQFSYAESSEQVEEIGKFLADKQKDPLLKICIGVYADAHTLDDKSALKNIESIWKAAEHFEGFVPILHFTFKFSSDPKKDIALIREHMPYVKYLRLNDLTSSHVEILKHANKFFLVDIPISNDIDHLIEDQSFIEEVKKHKVFVLIDNSHGQGKSDTKSNIRNKIDRLLAVGINDIALCGGYGPGSLDTYFDACKHYKINFSIDAETRLKTNDKIDIEKVKQYLTELMSHSL